MQRFLIIPLLLLAPNIVPAADQPNTGTRINISATAETSLANDEVLISFRVEKEGKSAAKVRQYINQISRNIQQRLKNEQHLNIKTLSRSIQPVWHYQKNKPRTRTAWRMVQHEQITSTKLDAVPHWLDAIEAAGAHLNSLQFRISKPASLKAQETLRLQAISLFRDKAKSISQGIDGKSFRIIRLNTNHHQPQPMRMQRNMAAMSKSSAGSPPSLSAGEGSLQVTVHGEIEVPFKNFSVK